MPARNIASHDGRDGRRGRAAARVHTVEQLLDDHLGPVAVRHLKKQTVEVLSSTIQLTFFNFNINFNFNMASQQYLPDATLPLGERVNG